MFKDYLNYLVHSALAKNLYENKNKNKNNKLVEEIKNGWGNLKDQIKEMPEAEKEIEHQIKYEKLLKTFLILIREFENNKVSD